VRWVHGARLESILPATPTFETIGTGPLSGDMTEVLGTGGHDGNGVSFTGTHEWGRLQNHMGVGRRGGVGVASCQCHEATLGTSPTGSAVPGSMCSSWPGCSSDSYQTVLGSQQKTGFTGRGFLLAMLMHPHFLHDRKVPNTFLGLQFCIIKHKHIPMVAATCRVPSTSCWPSACVERVVCSSAPFSHAPHPTLPVVLVAAGLSLQPRWSHHESSGPLAQ
jgi:hypothetical protein